MELLEFMYKYYDKKFEIYLKHVTPEGVPWYEEVIFYGEIDDWWGVEDTLVCHKLVNFYIEDNIEEMEKTKKVFRYYFDDNVVCFDKNENLITLYLVSIKIK